MALQRKKDAEAEDRNIIKIAVMSTKATKKDPIMETKKDPYGSFLFSAIKKSLYIQFLQEHP